MGDSTYRRLTIALSVLSIGLLAVSGYFFWIYGWLTIQVAFASEQTQIFDEMRVKALESDVSAAAGYLSYTATYYPSGSKQDAVSRLDQIVERRRAFAIRDIVAYLRDETGEDLGKDPGPWIQKYGTK